MAKRRADPPKRRVVLMCSEDRDMWCDRPLCDPTTREKCGCAEYAIIPLAELAKIEADAALVPGLKAAIAEKDGALDAAYSALRCLNGCFEKSGDQCVLNGEKQPCKALKAKRAIIHALSLTTESPAQHANQPPKQHLPKPLLETLANLTDNLEGTLRAVRDVRLANFDALPPFAGITEILPADCKITCEAGKEDAIYARIGRAVEEWQQAEYANTTPGQRGYRNCLGRLGMLIAETREAKS